MKLTAARVTNFRSVEDSEEFALTAQTCLVGKNEAGKSAILTALGGLNSHPATPFAYDVERDYPRRRLNEYLSNPPKQAAVVVSTTWMLSEDDKRKITADLGPDALGSDSVTILRRYGASGPEWSFPLNYERIVEHVLTESAATATERKLLGSPQTGDALFKALEGLAERPPRLQALFDRMSAWKGKNFSGRAGELVSDLPRFMYFSHYDRMAGQIRLDNFAERKGRGEVTPGEEVFVDFLNFAGTSIDEILGATTYEGLNARCEAASSAISNQLAEYWTQNPHLRIEVRVTKAEPGDAPPFNAGVIARARVKNLLHDVTTPFDERSAGFVWFFSFLVKFAQVKKSKGDLVLLLDEPGLSLHGKAQADLLNYFAERLAPKHQVIFSTHSPFMVPAGNFEDIRIVEDRVISPRPGVWKSEGTKVRDDVLAVDPDTLFPLQGALGYELTQSLFVGKDTLLVEGPSDLLYLQAFSSALQRRGSAPLDSRWSICPAGGIDKIQPFMSLFSGASLNIAAITDYAATDKQKIERLRKAKVAPDSKLLTYADVLNLAEADVEDLFSPELYVQIVNSAYGLEGTDALTVARLDAEGGPSSRLVKRVETVFRVLSPTAPEFDHYSPAEHLIRNPSILDKKLKHVEATLDNAARVIQALNALL